MDSWLHDTVSYAGRLCLDGTEISGEWSTETASGEFLMIRTPPDREAMLRSVYQSAYAIGRDPAPIVPDPAGVRREAC